MLYYHQGMFIPRVVAMRATNGLGNGYSFGNDFYQIWLSSREWLRQGRDPYSPEVTRDIQIGLYGRPLNQPRDQLDRRAFPYPVFTDLLFWPTTRFPFHPLRIAVVCVLVPLAFAAVLMWLRVLECRLRWQWIAVIVLLTLCSYPALEGLYAAQVGLLVSFLLAASFLALQRHRFLLAGFFMAITTIKPQVTVLVICYLLLWSLYDWRARGRFVLGFCSTMTLLFAASLAALPHWVQWWAHQLLAYHNYTLSPLVTAVLTSDLGRLTGLATFVLTAGSVVTALLLSWRNRAVAFGSFAFWITVTLILCITIITILPGQAIYDHLNLLPGVLLLVRYRDQLLAAGRVPRILLSIGALILLWPYAAAFALILLSPWLASAIFDSLPVFLLPIRTAASIPFAVLALLAWTWQINARHPEAVAVSSSV